MARSDEGHQTWMETEEIPSIGRPWMWVAFGIALLALLLVPALVVA